MSAVPVVVTVPLLSSENSRSVMTPKKQFAVCVQGALERLWQSQCEASGMTVFSLLGEGDNDYSISSQHKVWRILSAQ